MRPNHALPRALPVLYNCSFCFGTELHLYMHASAFRMIPWFSAGLTNSTHTIFSRVSNVVNCGWVNMNWRGVCAKKSFCIYQSTTWLGRNRILVVLWTIIFLSKVTLCTSCLKTCNWFTVWLRMTLEFFHLLSHLLRLEKDCSGSLFFHLTP